MPDIILSGGLIFNEKRDALLMLHRPNRGWWEIAGGKVEAHECKNPASPTQDELAAVALREMHEELGRDLVFKTPRYFATVEFTAPDGKKIQSNMFETTLLEGTPAIIEPQTFDKLAFVSISELTRISCAPNIELIQRKLTALTPN